LVSYIIEYSNWQTSFYVTGLTAIALLLPLSMIIKTRSSPKHQTGTNLRPSVNQKWYQVFLISTLQLIIAVYIILWVAKSSVNNWAQLYLQEVCQQCMLIII
jgi:sugar phosphate permease